MALGKLDDVGEVRAAERVDRLRVVAHDHQVAVDSRDLLDDLRLQPVRVLVLVDEHVAPELVLALADLGMLRQELVPEGEEIVEIHQVELALAGVVPAAGLDDEVLDLVEGGVFRGDEFLEGDPGVAGVAGDVEKHVALGELDGLVLPVARPQVVHELAGVLAVKDREVGLVADEGRVASEDEVADVVEGAAGDAPLVAGDEHAHAVEHLAGGLVREREEEDLRRRDAGLEETGDAVGERAGLAAAGAGDDEQGPGPGEDDLELLLVEFLLVVDRRRGRGGRFEDVFFHGGSRIAQSVHRWTEYLIP